MFDIRILSLSIFLICNMGLRAQNGRELNLSGGGWRVWLDSAATWQNDTLHLPRTLELSTIKSNSPTCGWNLLFKDRGIRASVPASFEELFGKGDPLWRYHGVGWFAKEIDVPTTWADKTVVLLLEKARLRVEIYVNEQLAGYDLVAETPYSVDITRYLKIGQTNRIAFRVTNPGGQRGWLDAPAIAWGKTKHCPSHDFGGLGNVGLRVTSNCYISDVFVKNVLPAKANAIELQVSVTNTESVKKTVNVESEIVSCQDGKTVATHSWQLTVDGQATASLIKRFSVPDAKLWDIDSPNLYYCHVRVSGDGVSDQTQTRFGFRVFEVKADSEGKDNFYLNGRRIRIRSAIDWGYYWQTGFYATEEMARKSVENAKAIGHNCISFHRRIGEPLVMKYADELGLLIYEEPGGMQGVDELQTPSWIMRAPYHQGFVAANTIPEKFSRMVKRDRNHPSVVIWSIVNEQSLYDYIHKKVFEETWMADDSRLLVNQSGGNYGDASGPIPHMRPYEANPRLDYIDDHTVDANSRFQESDLFSHDSENDNSIIYWGEVRCYCGPDNYYLLANPENKQGYDYKSWEVLGKKTEAYFKQNDFSKHPNIKGPADLSKQAGRGLMYINGRLSQAILSNNTNDGYAINGWSSSDQSLGDDMLSWYSSICDEGRNLKGPAEDYRYWTRSLQTVVRRINGKYFQPGDTAHFRVGIINEHKLTPGSYELKIEVLEERSRSKVLEYAKQVNVMGGDDLAQTFLPDFPVVLQKNWNAGYVTVQCLLLKNGKTVAEGMEQVLLKNRASWKAHLAGKSIAVLNWKAAESALGEAGTNFSPAQKATCILAGEVVDKALLEVLLKQVKAGAGLVVRFDSAWAKLFYELKILKTPVAKWGGFQKPYWNGNGWGYIDLVTHTNAVSSGYTLGTNSWEPNSDPVGFEPFESNFPQKSHGAFFFRPDMLLTLMGEISYGKGKILLAPSYPVDDDNAFNDRYFLDLINHCSSN